MNLETYVSFLNKIGRKVIWSNGIPFYSYRSGFLWSVPQSASYNVDRRKLKHLLWEGKALGIIYTSSNVGNKEICIWVVNSEYEISKMQDETRRKTRRGLERCEIHKLDWKYLAEKGFSINVDALNRQQRKSGRLDNPEWWRNFCKSSAEYSDLKAYGAFVGGDLASYTNVIILDNIEFNGERCRIGNVVHTMSHGQFLRGGSTKKSFPNEALVYYVTKKLLEKDNCKYVLNGILSDNKSLDAWKRWMGYSQMSVAQSVIANPLLHLIKPFVPKLNKLLR